MKKEWQDLVEAGWIRATFEYPDGRIVRVKSFDGLFHKLHEIEEERPATEEQMKVIRRILKDRRHVLDLVAAVDRPDFVPVQITARDAAEMMTVTMETLERWRKAGTGPRWHYLHENSKYIRYFQHEVARWMLANGEGR